MEEQSEETDVKPAPLRTGEKGYCLRCPMHSCIFYSRSYVNYDTHLERIHFCSDCAKYCHEKNKHICASPGSRLGHPDTHQQPDLTNFSELSRSHLGSMLMYKYNQQIEAPDIESTFTQINTQVTSFIKDLFVIHGLIKLEIGMGIEMEKEAKDDDGNLYMHSAVIFFKSRHYELQWSGGIESILLNAASDIVDKKNTFLENGSGWSIRKMASFELKMAEISLFQNSIGTSYLPMPFPKRKGIVNFHNKNNKCFLYCVSAALNWETQIEKNKSEGKRNHNLRKHRTWEKYFSNLNTTSVNGPVDVYRDVPVFEENNRVAINVLTHDKKNVIPMRTSKHKFEKVINLFLVRAKVKSGFLHHFVLIKDIDLFLRNKAKNKVSVCDTCFRDFRNKTELTFHQKSCGTDDAIVKEKFPKVGDYLEFKRPEMTLSYPFILYWDFEAFSTPLGERKGINTTINAEYKPASYSICLVNSTPSGTSIVAFEYYDGPRPVEHFFERVFYYSEWVLYQIRSTNNFVIPTRDEVKRHENAKQCDFCEKEFTLECPESSETQVYTNEGNLMLTDVTENTPKTKKVLKCYHHEHQSGRFLYSLCQTCNLKIKYKNELVCVVHNGCGYDFHILLQHLETPLFDPKDVNVISKGGEKVVQIEITAKNRYIPELKTKYSSKPLPFNKKTCGLRKLKVRFIDSYQFLSSSLSNLATGLKNENRSSFKMLNESIPHLFPDLKGITTTDVSLLLEKLPYPYAYLSSPDVLTDGNPVPDRKYFYNDLKKEEISDKDWATVQQLIKTFSIKDFRAFTRIYTMIDTVLLAVVWENFRKNCIKSYILDPCFVCTASGYSWQCFLSFTKAKIGYIRDKDMLDMVKGGIRGGTSFCTKKIVTANNERSPLGFDPSRDRTHIVYNDKVSLYAAAMLDKFPKDDFEWTPLEKLKSIDWKTFDGENDTGYILDVSLRYPKKLQDETEDLPLLPERKRVQMTDLSVGQQNALQSMGLARSFTTQPRLLLHCNDRIHYTLHYKALKYYLGMGIELLDIHSGFQFKEEAYFRPYIEYNILQRKLAQSESQRALFKILNNSIFGKCLQSNKGNLTVKFCGSKAESKKWTVHPRCKDFMPISENVSMVMLLPKVITLDKPIQSGMTCLDLAKVIFYFGYYQQLKLVFPGGIYNNYMDTDSSIITITDPGSTFFNDLVSHRHFFDFSKIPANHEIFKIYAHVPDLRTKNAGVAGLWKLESIDIAQIVTIKSKQYSILYFNQLEDLKCKGVPFAALKSFTHEKYKSIIENNQVVQLKCNYIRSINHKLYNITVNKIGFHCLDIYRVYPDPNDYNFSLPLGHYRLSEFV